MTDTVVVPVNARLAIPTTAADKLRALYSDAASAQHVADIYLHGVCAGLGIDRERVVAFDGDTGELVLDEPDPDRMPEQAAASD